MKITTTLLFTMLLVLHLKGQVYEIEKGSFQFEGDLKETVKVNLE